MSFGYAIFATLKGEGIGFRFLKEVNLFNDIGTWEAKGICALPGNLIPKKGEFLIVRNSQTINGQRVEFLAEYAPNGQREDGRPAYAGGMVYSMVNDDESLEPMSASKFLSGLVVAAKHLSDEEAYSIDSDSIKQVCVARVEKSNSLDNMPVLLNFTSSENISSKCYKRAFYTMQGTIDSLAVYGTDSQRLRDAAREVVKTEEISFPLLADKKYGSHARRLDKRPIFQEKSIENEAEESRSHRHTIKTIFDKFSRHLADDKQGGQSQLVEKQYELIQSYREKSDMLRRVGILHDVNPSTIWAYLFIAWEEKNSINGLLSRLRRVDWQEAIRNIHYFEAGYRIWAEKAGYPRSEQNLMINSFYNVSLIPMIREMAVGLNKDEQS